MIGHTKNPFHTVGVLAHRLFVLSALASAFSLLACQPKIGEKCDPTKPGACVAGAACEAYGGPVCIPVFATGADLWREVDKHNGKLVVIANAKVKAGRKLCTLVGCTPADPCCNSCSQELSIEGTEFDRFEMRDRTSSACGGTECSIECPILGQVRRITGRVTLEPGYGKARAYMLDNVEMAAP